MSLSTVSNKMMIPDTIRVGFQKRNDTYTGQLAYVIYYDKKGKIRKETSWQSWRDKKIEAQDFANTPRSGFVLNKKVGGYKSDWNMRNTYVRVYDPHGFEFEISIPNLLFILQETSAIKGKGLEGEFVYSWDGSDLILLPTCSDAYRECSKFSNLQAEKVTKDNVIEGHTYLMKDMTPVIYLGRHEYCEQVGYDTKKRYRPVGPRHIFENLGYKPEIYSGKSRYIIQTGYTKLGVKTSTEVSPEYAKAYDRFKKSPHSNRVTEIKLRKKVVSEVLGANDVYFSENYLLKEGDQYYPARISRRSRGWGYGCLGREYEYDLAKGEKPYKLPELPVKGALELPKFPPYSYHSRDEEDVVTAAKLVGLELYTVKLAMAKGDDYDLSKDSSY